MAIDYLREHKQTNNSQQRYINIFLSNNSYIDTIYTLQKKSTI